MYFSVFQIRFEREERVYRQEKANCKLRGNVVCRPDALRNDRLVTAR